MNYNIILPIDTLDSKISFKGNLIKDLVKDLKLALINKDLLRIQDLSLELHISGTKGFNKWLDTIIEFYILNININNIYIIPHIFNFINYWIRIDDDIKKKKPLDIVNDQVIRNFIFFMNWIICHSEYSPIDKNFKIMNMTTDDLNFKEMKKNDFLVSKNLNNVSKFIFNDDPKEIIIPLSEICELLTNEHKNKLINLTYWFSWLLYYERTYHKSKLDVKYRNFNLIDDKFRTNWIVILLDIILHHSELYPVSIKKYIFYLVSIYSNIYSPKNKKTYGILILFVFKLMSSPYNHTPINSKLFSEAYGYSAQCNFHYKKNIE
jgi:hypothetical protein